MLRRITVVLLSLLVGCSTVRRSDRDEPAESVLGQQPGVATPSVSSPTVQPKIGVILGPGGLKTFAQIGVLRELEGMRIPIDRIAGLEWGALVAGLYSLKGKSNDVEWKLYKLSKEVLPKKALLGRALESSSMTDMEHYLDDVFEGKQIPDGEIPFMCPARSLTKYSNLIFQKNKYSDALELCLPFPPFFKPHQNWVASPYSVKMVVDAMRKAGIDYIILVNVTPGLQKLGDGTTTSDVILWTHIMDEMNEAKNYVNYVIDVNIQDKTMFDFDSRREFILIGQQYGKIAAQRLARMLGF